MAVLVEAHSIILRRKAIDHSYPGGWGAFVTATPNRTLCFDDDLARVGFMDPTDAQRYIKQLQESGLVFLVDGQAVDFTVVDQFKGPAVPTGWLEFARVRVGEGNDHVSSCWLFDGPRTMVGIHMPGLSVDIATPDGWVYEGSLSQAVIFAPDDRPEEKMKFLRHEDGTDYYIDLGTGKEVFIGRTAK